MKSKKILILSDVHGGIRDSIAAVKWNTYSAIPAFHVLHQELIDKLLKEDYDIIILLGDMIEGSKLAKEGKSHNVWTMNTTEQSKAVKAFLEEAKILPLGKRKLYSLMGTKTHDNPEEIEFLGNLIGAEKDGDATYFNELTLGIYGVWCHFLHNCSCSSSTLEQELKSGVLIGLKEGYRKILMVKAHLHKYKRITDENNNEILVNFGLTYPTDFAIQKGLRNRTETIGYTIVEIFEDGSIVIKPVRILLPPLPIIKIC